MHHDLTPYQRARLAIFTALQEIDGIVDHDTFDLLRAAHWIAYGDNPDSATALRADTDTTELELADPAIERPMPWRPAVN